MEWVRECPKCGKQRVYNRDTGTCYECAQAPKEEEMEPKLDRWIPCKNRSCTEVRYGTGEPILCNLCIEKRATELRAETERARAARFGTKRFTSLAATPDIPAGNADRDCQLTGAADACNHGAGVGLIAVGI